MAKKSEKHEMAAQQAGQAKEKPSKWGKACCCGQKPLVMMIALVIVGLTVGALVMYAAVGGQQVVRVNASAGSCTPVACAPAADVNTVKSKVVGYIEGNLLNDPSMKLSIKSAESMGEFYNISFDVLLNGTGQGDGMVLASLKDLVIPSVVLDMDEPLPVQESPPPADLPKSDKPSVQLFIMAFCPYGVNAVEQMKAPVQLLGSKIDFRLGYVIYSDFAAMYGEPWADYCSDENETYCSMHGAGELREDIRQMCIREHQADKLWAYLSEVVAAYNEGTVSASNIDTKWKDLATAAGVDVAKVESCVASEAGTLLADEAALNAQYGVRGSPMLVINGVEAQVQMSPEALKTGICSAFNSAPSECQQVLGSSGGTISGGCG